MTARRLAALAAALAALAVLLAAPSANAAPKPQKPDLTSAAAAIVIDARTGETILAKNPLVRRQIASTTKIMTGLLTVELARPNQVYTAPEYDAAAAESRINLRKGERMTVEDLLHALLLYSANDAAATLAKGVAGSEAGFVAKMNAKAQSLGLKNTHYANPVGLDDPGNYSTAHDLAELGADALRDRRFARIVDTKVATLTSGARPRTVRNRNNLLQDYPDVDGIKTGYTKAAGNLLVGAAKAPNGAQVVSVVMGEPTETGRDADSLALLRYGLSQFRRSVPVRKGRAAAKVKVKYRDQRVLLGPARTVRLTVRKGQKVTRSYDKPDELKGPIRTGRRVGSVTLLVDGKAVKRVGLVTLSPVPGAGPIRKVASSLGLPLTLILLLAMVGGAAIGGMRLQAARERRRREERRRSRTA